MAQDEITALLTACGVDEKTRFQIWMGLEEAIVNAAKHGNQLDESKKVRFSWLMTAESIVFEIEDEGDGFDLEDVPNPLDAENLERPCGRGLFLIRQYMTTVDYNSKGNMVRMTKVFKEPAQPMLMPKEVNDETQVEDPVSADTAEVRFGLGGVVQ